MTEAELPQGNLHFQDAPVNHHRVQNFAQYVENHCTAEINSPHENHYAENPIVMDT